MARSQTYQDRCGVARALDVIGERWALLVVRELLLGSKRFTDLRRGLPKVSAEVLGQRLRDLEQAGLVFRETLPAPAGTRVYSLTPRGAALEPVVLALGRWGAEQPLPFDRPSMSVDSHLLALKTLLHPDVDDRSGLTLGLDLSGEQFQLAVDGGALQVSRGPALEPDVSFVGQPEVLLDLVRHRRLLDETIKSGEAKINGDVAAFRRFITRFHPDQQQQG